MNWRSQRAGITGIVLDCEGIDFIDSQGSAKMGEILELTNHADVTLRLARLKPVAFEILEAGGFHRADRCRPDPRERLQSRPGGDDPESKREPDTTP